MSGIDKKERLDEEPFGFQLTKNGTLLISHEGKMAVTLKGKDAERLSRKLAAADSKQVQLLLAKATGNFKRGNEKAGKMKGE